jgi:hypothetical protein
MKAFIALAVCIMLPASTLAKETGYKVAYDGGSISSKVGGSLYLSMGENVIQLSEHNGSVVASIPAASVTEISYGQDVHRRVGTAIGLAVVSFGIGALMALSKSKKHYVGLTWADGEKKGGIVVQCDKNDYRGVLAGLEGITGKKAVDSDTMTVKN